MLGLRDEVLDIAVTPDRGYCLSMRGICPRGGPGRRGGVPRPGGPAGPAGDRPTGTRSSSQSDACPLFVAVTVTGVDPSRPSPRWLARRVQLAGMRSISLAVDITNYVMLETGQPIHAYDAGHLDGPILVRRALEGEKLTTLDDVVRPLDADDLVITDDTGPIGLAGVMGGAVTELSAGTTAVVIEAAHFDAMTLARTSRRHKLSSEASRRFERGVDPAAAYAAAHRVAELLVELAGGTLGGRRDGRGAVPAATEHHDRRHLPARVLGTPVDHDTVVGLLTAVGATVVGDDRLDGHPAQLATGPDRPVRLRRGGRAAGRLRHHRAGGAAGPGRARTDPVSAGPPGGHRGAGPSGFVEVLSFPFASVADLDRMGVPAGDERRRLNRIVNPLAETTPYLRTSLLPGLFAAVDAEPQSGQRRPGAVRVGFGVLRQRARCGPRRAPRSPSGRRTPRSPALDAALGRQPRHLAAVLCGMRRSGWSTEASRSTGRTRSRSSRSPRRPSAWRWNGGRRPARPGIRVDARRSSSHDRVVGYAGELHPDVCRAFGLPAADGGRRDRPGRADRRGAHRRRGAAGLRLPGGQGGRRADRRRRRSGGRGRAGPPSGAGPLLESVALFDVYTGPPVPRGPQVAGLRPALPGPRPYPHRRRDRGGAGRGGRRGRRADRRRPAHALIDCSLALGRAGSCHLPPALARRKACHARLVVQMAPRAALPTLEPGSSTGSGHIIERSVQATRKISRG